jgi:hypothetical protein
LVGIDDNCFHLTLSFFAFFVSGTDQEKTGAKQAQTATTDNIEKEMNPECDAPQSCQKCDKEKGNNKNPLQGKSRR